MKGREVVLHDPKIAGPKRRKEGKERLEKRSIKVKESRFITGAFKGRKGQGNGMKSREIRTEELEGASIHRSRKGGRRLWTVRTRGEMI